MAQTEHFVQTFRKQGKRLVGKPPERCKGPDHARARAHRAAEQADGVVAFSITGEPEFGEFDPPLVLAKHGDTPPEFD